MNAFGGTYFGVNFEKFLLPVKQNKKLNRASMYNNNNIFRHNTEPFIVFFQVS